jgi:hypothetical protein
MSYPDWSKPTDEMRAALAMAIRARKMTPPRAKSTIRELTEIQVAEAIMMAKDGFAIRVLQGLIETPPSQIAEGSRPFFKDGCESMKAVLDLGYSEAEKMWWPLKTIWPNSKVAVVRMALMADALGMMHDLQYPSTPMGYLRPPDDTPLIPASIWLYADLILGYNWRKRFAGIMPRLIGAIKAYVEAQVAADLMEAVATGDGNYGATTNVPVPDLGISDPTSQEATESRHNLYRRVR